MSLFVSLILILFSCAKNPVKTQIDKKNFSESYNLSIRYFEEEKYNESKEILTQLLSETTDPHLVKIFLFSRGRNLQKLGKWTQALEDFKKLKGISQSNEIIYKKSKYQIGLCFEALGDNIKAISAYSEALIGFPYNEYPLEYVEVKAHLAASYARFGNESISNIFYEDIENKIQSISVNKNYPEWMPKTLFEMGQITGFDFNENDILSKIKTFRRSQIWLLKSAEMNNEHWSKKSSHEIINFYFKTLSVIENLNITPSEDSDGEIDKLNMQNKQKIYSSDLLKLLQELKMSKLPNEVVNLVLVNDIFNNIKTVEDRLEQIIQSPTVANDVTSAAKQKELLNQLKALPKVLPKKSPHK